MVNPCNKDRIGAFSCSRRYGKRRRTSTHDPGNRNGASEPKLRKMPFFAFWGHPLDGPEESAQAAPRTANSMGTRLAAPILKSALIAMLVAFPKSQSQRNPLVCEIQILMIKYRRSMFFMPYFIQTRPIILKDEPSPLSTAGRLIGWLNLTKFVAVQYWHWRTPQRAGKCTPTEPTSA